MRITTALTVGDFGVARRLRSRCKMSFLLAVPFGLVLVVFVAPARAQHADLACPREPGLDVRDASGSTPDVVIADPFASRVDAPTRDDGGAWCDAAPVASAVAHAPASTVATDAPRTLSVAMARASGGHGIRVELDVHADGPWLVGIGVEAGSREEAVEERGIFGPQMLSPTARELAATVYAARAFGRGAWRLRASGGVGARSITLEDDVRVDLRTHFDGHESGTFIGVEASVVVMRELSSDWMLFGGAVVLGSRQIYEIDDDARLVAPRVRGELVAGVRCRL